MPQRVLPWINQPFVLRYFLMCSKTLHQLILRHRIFILRHPLSKQEAALLAAILSKKASIFDLFGGQGTNEVYFDKLQNLYDIYKPFVAPFVETLTKDILAPLVAEEKASTHNMFGLDRLSWLSGAAAHPAVSYLASVPVSFPLIGLTPSQLVQYLVVCHIANLTGRTSRWTFWSYGPLSRYCFCGRYCSIRHL